MGSSLLRVTYKKNILVLNGILEEFSAFNANVKRFLVISCWKVIKKEITESLESPKTLFPR